MAKRDEYPGNRNMIARLECLAQSHATMRSVLRNTKMLLGSSSPSKAAVDELLRQIDEAIAQSEIAGNALSGYDE